MVRQAPFCETSGQYNPVRTYMMIRFFHYPLKAAVKRRLSLFSTAAFWCGYHKTIYFHVFILYFIIYLKISAFDDLLWVVA